LGPEEQGGGGQVAVGGAAAIGIVAPRGQTVHLQPYGRIAHHLERPTAWQTRLHYFSSRSVHVRQVLARLLVKEDRQLRLRWQDGSGHLNNSVVFFLPS